MYGNKLKQFMQREIVLKREKTKSQTFCRTFLKRYVTQTVASCVTQTVASCGKQRMTSNLTSL